MTNRLSPDKIEKVDLNLPTLPGVALALLEIVRSASPDIKKAAEIISTDAPLSAKVLKMVNSPFYGRVNRIGSVHQAMMMLGMITVKNLALSFSLVANFRPKRNSAFADAGFWKDSLAGAVAAQVIAAELQNQFADEAFFCGLLQNIGSLILAESFPDRYGAVAERSGKAPNRVHRHEYEIFGLDHTGVGQYAVHKWGLPAYFIRPIRFHHLEDIPADVPSREIELTKILQLSSLFIEGFRAGSSGTEFEAIHRYLTRNLFDRNIDVAGITRTISSRIRESSAIFDIEVDRDEHARIVETAKKELSAVTGQLIEEVEKQSEKIEVLKRESSTDGLTGLHNQRHFIESLKREIERAYRYGAPLSLVMADIDKFKTINDFHGHLTGDEVLKAVASRLRATLRSSDYLARYGGEEFAIIFPGTSEAEAWQATERLRNAVRREAVSHAGKSIPVTMSFGVVSMGECGGRIDLESFIHMADEALYEAKNSGRNKCCIYKRQQIDQGLPMVLVVDDEEVVLETLSKMLERLGYGVVTAGDGQAALELVGRYQNRIDTVFLDVMMPGIGPGEIVGRIKKGPNAPRIFLSSGYSPDRIDKDLMAACDGFLAKPYTLADLLSKLRSGGRDLPAAGRRGSAAAPAPAL